MILSLCHLCCAGRVPGFPLDLMSENVRFCELFVVIFTTLHTIMVQSTDLKMQKKLASVQCCMHTVTPVFLNQFSLPFNLRKITRKSLLLSVTLTKLF